MQMNFCFFRSKGEDQISWKDLELSTPLFNDLIAIIKPARIIGFSSKLRNHIMEKESGTRFESANIPSNNRTLMVAKGMYRAIGNEVPIFFLPHPNAKFTSEARRKAWDFCFSPNI